MGSKFVHVLTVGAAVACGACGSSSSGLNLPTVNTNLTVSALSLSINPPAIGATSQASAAATYSNGSTGAIVTGFSSDNTAVATITASGLATGVSVGDATITVTYQGMTATKRIHVLPNYNGIFSGTYLISACTSTDGLTDLGFCSSFPVGTSYPFAVNNTQSADLASLAGFFAIGSIQGVGNGTIDASGNLTYAGSTTIGTTTVLVQNLTASINGAGHMVGSFQQVWTDSTVAGSGTVVCLNLDMARSTGSVVSSAAPNAFRRLRDVLLAAAQR